MGNRLITTLAVIAALGAGLNAGFFFSFSAVIMKSLGRLPPEQGIAAMQRINVVVLNPWFFAVFFGTAIVCICLAALAALRWSATGTLWLLAASAVYLIGVIFATIAFNVPLNNALAKVNPGSIEGARLWVRYLSVWTSWNHVRTVAPLVAAALFIVALR